MSIRTLPVTAAGFERVLATIAVRRTGKAYRPLNRTDWRKLATQALEEADSGNVLRRSIEALSAECREVLFLRDLKNLGASEAAWILGITVGAVRIRLRRARTQMRSALASVRPGRKNARFGNSCEGFPANLPFLAAAFVSQC